MGVDEAVVLWNVPSGKKLATLYDLGNQAWAVVTPDGRFDASPGAMTRLRFTNGLGGGVDLKHLRNSYYDPYLLAKLMGYDSNPLRSIPKLDGPENTL